MSDRPNIVVFMTDDHGQWALGCYGHSLIRSPSIDHLAHTGVRLDRAFTPTPVCSPARASFFTGLLASQHGIHDWLKEHESPFREHPGLSGQMTLGPLLQSAGYETALMGKWHCGASWEPKPGFDHWFSYGKGQRPHKGKITFSDRGRMIDYDGYQTVAITDRTIEFLRNRDRQKPFFLFVGYVDTHAPYVQHPERLVQRYCGATFDPLHSETPAPCHGDATFAWYTDPAQSRESLAQYFAAVDFIDEQVGRVLDHLDTAGDLANTLVVYTSDHGHMTGRHGLNTKGNTTTPVNFIDDSILVPCVMSWPARLPAGRVLDPPVDHCDLFRTVLDAAGVECPRTIDSPGESCLPLLEGKSIPWRDAYFGEYGNSRCIRTASHKLILRYPGPNGRFPDELYDLVNDPRERSNVIGDPANASVAAALTARLSEHFARYEVAARSGLRVAELPPASDDEPWRRPV